MKNMRKMFALAMVALLALILAMTAVGCGNKAEETPSSESSMPPADAMSDSSMHSDSAMADTSMSH